MTRLLRHLAVLLAAAATFAALPATAAADDSRSSARATGVLMLMTEEVQTADAQRPQVRFWWSEPKNPAWTTSDQLLLSKLEERGVRPLEPSGDARVSSIYRTHRLSLVNAATLGSLFGAQKVLTGSFSYEELDETPLRGMQGVRANAELKLVSATSSDPSVLRTFSFERAAFADDAEQAMTTARRKLTSAVAGVVGSALVNATGPVGVQSNELHLGLHNVENGRALQMITDFLETVEGVDDVQIRWASEGLVALELNAEHDDTDDSVRRIARVLSNHRFDGLTLEGDETRQEGMLTLDVELSPSFDSARGD